MNNSTLDTSGNCHIGRCDFSSTESKFDAFIYISIAIVALFENITISVCYFRYRPLRNATNLCLISLTASDILVATLSIPLTFAVYLCELRPSIDQRDIGDLIYLICDMLPSILSIYSLCLVAIDRVIAVTGPYTYARYVTHRTAAVSTVLMWIFVTFIVSLILIMEKDRYTLFIVIMSYIFPVTVMLISYSIIGYVAKKHARAITIWEKTRVRLNKKRCSSTSQDESYPSTEDNEKQQKIAMIRCSLGGVLDIKHEKVWANQCQPKYLWRELKASLKLLLLLAAFTIAWTPFMALNIEYYRCNSCYIDSEIIKAL